MVVGIKDIAAYLGLSTSTVSRALNDYGDVAAETVKRVRQAAQQLGYYPSASARNLRRRRTGMIGLALLFSSAFATFNEFFAEVVRLAAATAERQNYNLVLYTRAGDEPGRLARLAQTREVDGLLLLGDLPGTDEAIHRLRSAAMPLVVLGRQIERTDVSYVTIDLWQATRLALGHLVALGRRRIGYISFSRASRYSQERLTAYRSVAAELGLPHDDSLIAYASLEPDSGAHAIAALLAGPQPPDAVFVYNDRLAIEVLQRLAQDRVRVPEDLAIVGFDDVRTARMTMPPLTTIRYPLAEVIERAVGALLTHQSEPDSQAIRQIVPVELIVRGSTSGNDRNQETSA